MAKRNLVVPDYNAIESSGNRARSVGGSGPGSAGFNNTAASDLGAGFAALAEASQRISFERDSVAAVKAETDGLIKQDAAIAALDPLAADYNDRVKAIVEDNKRETLEKAGISNSAVKDDLSRRMDRSGAAAQITSQRIRKDAVSKETERVAFESVDMVAAKVRTDPANANAYMTEFQGNMERLKIGMDPARVPAFAAAAADIFAKNQVIGYAEKGNIGAARATLKEQAQYLKGETVTGLSSYIDGRESKLRADGERAKTANTASRMLDIEDQYNGAKPIDPGMREKLDADLKSGRMSPEQHLASVRFLNNQSARYNKEAQKNAKAAEQLATGTLSSQENADRGFANQFGNLPFGRIAMQGTPEQKAAAIQLATSMAGGSGYLPTQMKDLISNSDNITNPQQAQTVAFAAEAVDEIEAKAPGKIAGVSLSDTGVVNRVRARARVLMQDMPAKEAYLQAAQTEMPKDRLTAQQENDSRIVAKEAMKKINIDQELAGAVKSWDQRNLSLFVSSPEVAGRMKGEWQRVFEDAMIATRDNVERSKALANKKIADNYGQTKVGMLDARQAEQGPGFDEFGVAPNYTGMKGQGTGIVQKHPPEKYMTDFPMLNQDQRAKLIMADLDKIFRERGIGPSPSPDLTGAPVVELRADATTEADLRNGRKPTYAIFVLRGDLPEPISTNKGPLRYRLPSPDEVKDNPVWMGAERDRQMRDEKAKATDIELKKAVPDPVADERARRMREEGRKAKGNR